MKKQYPYAVIDGNQAPDQYLFAESCHYTLDAARRLADKWNRMNPNYHYYVVEWHAGRWDRLRPAPEHCPIDAD